jgi:acylphosphatase
MNPAPGMKRLCVYFLGRVQGVGFRFTVQNLTQNRPVTGFVRNLADGRVELVAEGKEQELRAFLEAIQSHMARYIHECKIQWSVATGEFKQFEVKF